MRRFLTCSMPAAMLLASLLPARALAGGSPPVAVAATFDLPADFFKPGACPFPIRVTQSGKAGTIALPDARFVFTSPGVTVTVTNLADPTRFTTLVATGAFHQTTSADGTVTTVVTGRNVLGDPLAGFVLAIGTFSFAFDADGNLVQPLAGTGELVDICALLQ